MGVSPYSSGLDHRSSKNSISALEVEILHMASRFAYEFLMEYLGSKVKLEHPTKNRFSIYSLHGNDPPKALLV